MPVRAKFTVIEKSQVKNGATVENAQDIDGYKISMTAVTTGSPENDNFFKYTPGGNLTLVTVSAAAADQLTVGKQYYLDITEAN